MCFAIEALFSITFAIYSDTKRGNKYIHYGGVYFPFCFGVENKLLGRTHNRVDVSLSSLPHSRGLKWYFENDAPAKCQGGEI